MRPFSALALLLLCVHHCLAGALLDMLDGMVGLMGDHGPFDRKFYRTLEDCMNWADATRLQAAVDGQWAGMMAYSDSEGDQGVDEWQQCSPLKWFEHNCTVQELGHLSIHEPCNYASNVAYYHTVTEICGHTGWSLPDHHVKAMAKVFTLLAQGSAFMHGSNTTNGGSCDVRLNDLFAYVVFQAAISNLKPANASIIHDLSLSPRQQTAAEWTDEFLDMFIEVPVKDWGYVLEKADFPSIRYGMCGFFATAMTLFLPPATVDILVSTLLSLFSDIPEDLTKFCLTDFLPEIRKATAHIQLTSEERVHFVGNLFSTLFKLIYGFVWQEQVLVNNPILLQPLANQLGASLLPIVNDIATKLNSFTYTDPNFQTGANFYPGEGWCNPLIPHAKWHLQTSIGLTDYVFLADQINQIIVAHDSVGAA